ncbi:hypothetical protein N0M98_19030 [Paenibacillus doosanensis]|uniref:Uncharacterized protein n=1 Tax=Paenibacillus konkukensis TaxID=2020716 RepID=A0ABY4RL76_9BACL|nr:MULTISPECIES: hypothetical protein [Paenibacillus]MCS7462238.1 hypothetical protein [Paenibacillus doosanensis]UQZ82898.1 hypothetical protein SK3146_02058 [Paenibacillus konkukensis]
MQSLIKILFSSIEFSAAMLFCLSLFRIYFRYSLHKVFIIAVIMSVISIYIREFLEQVQFGVLPVIVIQIVLITLFFNLPLIFSFLVCIIGTLAVVTIEGLVIAIGSNFSVFNEQGLINSTVQFICFESTVTLILLLLIFPLQKYKLGFHTTSNDALKGYNFYLSGLLIIGIVAIEIEQIAFKKSAVHIILPIIIGFIFLIGVYLAYQHNKRLWAKRRERLSKK